MQDPRKAPTSAEIHAAMERAHTLRSQAMTEGFRAFGRWMKRARIAPASKPAPSAC